MEIIRKSRIIVSELFFCITLILCLSGMGYAVCSFVKSLVFSNNIIDNAVMKGLDSLKDISLDRYIDIQMQLQELRSSSIQTNILTFLYQFISGSLIGVAAYLIRESSKRVNEAEEKTKTINDKMVRLSNASDLIAKNQKTSILELIAGRTSSYINHIYSSLQTYILLSLQQENMDPYALRVQMDAIIRRVNEEIQSFELFFDSSINLMAGCEENEKKQIYQRMRSETTILGEILKKENILPEEQFNAWNGMIGSIRGKINAKLLF